MIPLIGDSSLLSRVETSNLKHNNNIALTIVDPQNSQTKQLSSISSSPAFTSSFSPAIRILHSRAQRRRNSVSSLSSLVKFEDDALEKLSSTGSVKENRDDELIVYSENKTQSHQHATSGDVNLEDSSCSTSSVKEGNVIADIEQSCEYRIPDVASDNHSLDSNNDKSKRKCKSKSAKTNSKNKSKKHSKFKKSSKRKGNLKSSGTIPDVFERLANINKTGNSQEKISTSQNDKKCSQTTYFNSCGSYLEVKRLQTTYMPVNKPNKPKTLLYLPKVALSKSTNSVNKTQQPARHSSAEELKTLSSNHIGDSPRKIWEIGNSPRKSLDIIVQENTKNNFKGNSSRKVYLSEVHSKLIAGIPAAPPATPFQDELARIEYIPCLMDVKSQRAVKTKLEKIVLKLKLEKQQHKENALKQDEKKLKESLLQLKEKQRAEIYALNKVMTELENENFKKFMKTKEAVSLGV